MKNNFYMAIKLIFFQKKSNSIFKPPGSSALFAHVDESMENMLKRTSRCKTVKKWTNEYGYQALCHLSGASSESDRGRTCVLQPLTIKRYRTLLLMIKYEHEDIEKTEKWYKGDRNSVNAGAIECPWDKILIPANRIFECLEDKKTFVGNDLKWWNKLDAAQQESLEGDPKIPALAMQPVYAKAPYLICFPEGFPHCVEESTNARLSFALDAAKPIKKN
jgi:hypothetical protein